MVEPVMLKGREKEEIRKLIEECGAVKVGFATAAPMDEVIARQRSSWLDRGVPESVGYLLRHEPLKHDFKSVFPDAKTVISTAWSYHSENEEDREYPEVSAYARAEDYHNVIRDRLKPFCKKLKEEFGSEFRICIDSAPVAERYWAFKSGLGLRGLNGSVIIPGVGSMIFLAEILTILEIEPDAPCEEGCGDCRRCVEACPTGALTGDGMMNISLCRNYLTIEHKGEFDERQKELLRKEPAAGIYGCDICLQVCPYNREVKQCRLPEFAPNLNVMDYIKTLAEKAKQPGKKGKNGTDNTSDKVKEEDIAEKRVSPENFENAGNFEKPEILGKQVDFENAGNFEKQVDLENAENFKKPENFEKPGDFENAENFEKPENYKNAEIVKMGWHEEFAEVFRKSPIGRIGPDALLRNIHP